MSNRPFKSVTIEDKILKVEEGVEVVGVGEKMGSNRNIPTDKVSASFFKLKRHISYKTLLLQIIKITRECQDSLKRHPT